MHFALPKKASGVSPFPPKGNFFQGVEKSTPLEGTRAALMNVMSIS